MKNTFAVTMTLLLALTLGGSIAGYRIATTPHHAESHSEGGEKGGESHGEGSHSAAGTETQAAAGEEQSGEGQDIGTRGSEEMPSPQEAATGPAGASGALGNVRDDNDGGTQTGENGAVLESSDLRTGDDPAASTEGTAENPPAQEEAAQTGQPPATRAATAEPQGDNTAGGDLYASKGCAGCHGPQGQGGVGPSMAKVKDWSLEQFTATLREGKTPERVLSAAMPRFTEQQLTDSDIANLFSYVKTLN
ncbi:c-type cytochrome [Deinococcus arcticus]|uniref:Cytochrome C n=1 Tax=Deinococcus arcticus TaxID=2136176 RepID=A0A2T3W8G9_9DEIO|nr:cytochrome c [Deinococcus arcticus]PTA68198.1 cytochrome C [Deinococcus arcticus]